MQLRKMQDTRTFLFLPKREESKPKTRMAPPARNYPRNTGHSPRSKAFRNMDKRIPLLYRHLPYAQTPTHPTKWTSPTQPTLHPVPRHPGTPFGPPHYSLSLGKD